MTTDQPTTEKPLRQLTAQEFIDIITEVDKEKYAEFYQVNNHGDAHIVIKNVDIPQEIKLTDQVTVSLPLVIESGTFGGNFLIMGGVFSGNVRIGGGTFNREFLIRGGTFNGDLRILGGVFNGNFRILEGNFRENFWIQDGAFSQRISRIFVAYFVYQLIQAFRKHGRSSG